MSAVLKNFSENLKIRMSTQGVDAADLATVTGLSLQVVYQYMRGDTWPRPAQVELLCSALFCTPADLFREPIAQDRPNWPQAWQVMTQFVESLTPARRRLLDSTDKMPDQQLIGLANLADGIRRASASAGGIQPVPGPVDMLKALAALGDPRFAGLTRMSQAQLESLAFIVSHAGDNLPSGQADHAKKKPAKGKERA